MISNKLFQLRLMSYEEPSCEVSANNISDGEADVNKFFENGSHQHSLQLVCVAFDDT